MRRYRPWLFSGAALVVGLFVLAVVIEPTQTVRAWLAGEPFYQGKPLRAWREVLRRCGQDGAIPAEIASELRRPRDAFAVLSACARDSDRNVRWPAIALLGRDSRPSQPIQEILIAALEDEDEEVRLKAIAGLDHAGPLSRPAIAALKARLADPELQVAHCADVALWDIDETAAVSTCGWRSFHSSGWGFSVMLPEEPERKDQRFLNGRVLSHAFLAWHRAGPYQSPVRYVVQVTEYPKEVLTGSTDKEREQAARKLVPAMFPGGKVIEEKEITHDGLHGKEYLLETTGPAHLRARRFWAGRTQYSLLIAHAPKFLNPRAAAFFLDSFHLEQKQPAASGPKDRP